MSMLAHKSLALLAAGCLAVSICPATAQNNVTLERLSIGEPGTKTVLTIERVEVANTNLTRDEVARLFSSELKPEEALAATARLTADRLQIRGAVITGEEGRISFGTFTATGIDKGRFRKAGLDGMEANFQDKARGSEGKIVSRALELENGDIGPLIAGAQKGDFDASVFQVGRIDWRGFEARFTDPDIPANAPGGNLGKVSLASLTAATEYEGNVPRRSSGEARSLVIELPPTSDAGRQLKAFGYDKLDLGFSARASYDPARNLLALEDYTLSGMNAGRIGISGSFTGVGPQVLAGGDAMARFAAIAGAGISDIEVKFVNDGLADKAFAYAADMQGKSPAALKAEASAMAVQLLPLLLGGDPSSLALAQSVQTFLREPRNFTLKLKARGAPVPLLQIGSIGNPATFLALVEVTLLANQ